MVFYSEYSKYLVQEKYLHRTQEPWKNISGALSTPQKYFCKYNCARFRSCKFSQAFSAQ